jgi:hypothetical protein
MLPNRNDPAGNGVESQSMKAAGLASYIITDNTLSLDDRHAAWLSGFDYGYAQRVEHDLEELVRARLHQLSLEALGMARRHAAETGPAWASLIAWAGGPE